MESVSYWKNLPKWDKIKKDVMLTAAGCYLYVLEQKTGGFLFQ
jgi:hypothetical protein